MRFSLAVALILAAPAAAHDDAAWIARNPAYLAPDGAPCCGIGDCALAAPGEISRAGDVWIHNPTATVLRAGERGVYANPHDVGLWRCVRQGRLRCVFSAGGS